MNRARTMAAVTVLLLAACGGADDNAREVEAMGRVQDRLRDPGSVEWRRIHTYHGAGAPVVCGEVNAKNGFGGYAGFTEFISAGDATYLRSDVRSAHDWADVWSKFCTDSATGMMDSALARQPRS